MEGHLFQFFWHCATFFRFFCLHRVPTYKFFLIFCSKLMCQKAQRVYPFKYFGTMRLFKILILRLFFENFKFQRKIEFFFVSKGSPLHFFDILQKTGFSKNPKGALFTVLKTLRFLSLRYSADFRRSRLVHMNLVL